jgi:hypothetical protein
MKKRLHQIELFRKYPHDVQNELLGRLIEQGKNSAFGKEHRMHEVKSYSDFSERIPIQNYDSLKPWIDRLMNGEQNLLCTLETRWFAKSSGTTNDRSKFIPVTRDSIEECHYKGGKDLLALYYENFPNRKLYNGKHLIVGGSAQILPISEDAYSGDLSAIILKNLPWWAEIRRTPSKDIALMSNWEEKIEKMARSTIQEDVYVIAGVPSWTLLLCQKILEITKKKHLREVWPNLELFLHGGVNFEPYRHAFEELIPFDNMNYVETYNASEGFFGIQDQVHSNELLLMLDYGIFYEFIPLKQFNELNSTHIIPLTQVEVGVEYAIVITTNGGLWRYIVGDTVVFTDKYPYRFRISGRTKHFINTFGEELVVENVEKAIGEACQKTDALMKEFTVAPIYMEMGKSGQHEWLIEFTRIPNDLERFANLLDEKLREVNSDYDAKRTQDMILKRPSIQLMKPGVFETWLANKGKLGGQHKVPRLQNNREIVEQLLSIQHQ